MGQLGQASDKITTFEQGLKEMSQGDVQSLGKSVLYPIRYLKSKIRNIQKQLGHWDMNAGNELMQDPKVCCQWKNGEPSPVFSLISSLSTVTEASVKS